jgi:nitric oxide reductase NorD protein
VKTDVNNKDGVARLGLLASAIAHRPMQVSAGEPGELAWTDGRVVFVDVHKSAHEQVASLTVQATLLAAGSLDRDIIAAFIRRPALAKRYLGVEGHRALAALAPLLPSWLQSLHCAAVAARSDSPRASLATARSRDQIGDPPVSFGTISARRLFASLRRTEGTSSRAPVAHRQQALVELAEDANTREIGRDNASSIGGGGAIGKWLSKMLTAARQISGGGSPGADAPTHWTRSGRRSHRQTALSTASTGSVEESARETRAGGTKYPEWDVHSRHYRMDWCTVSEREVTSKPDAARFAVPERMAMRRSLARLGLGIDRYHRQSQGDDIDIDAAIEARVEMLAGSSPDESFYINGVRRRRDLSVLLLLDISGSAAEPAEGGKTVHEQQRAVAAALTLALHDLGDRVALYAYHSQGRNSVALMPVKRFGEDPGAIVMRRLGSLEPGAYSRLGAAIRHGTAVLQDHGATRRQLLIVLSDGLAYDHGYEPGYGAADAQRALGEARSQGVGCLCLSIGANTDHESLRRVFGKSAHAALASTEQLSPVIGPLFRSAIRSADVRRRLE